MTKGEDLRRDKNTDGKENRSRQIKADRTK